MHLKVQGSINRVLFGFLAFFFAANASCLLSTFAYAESLLIERNARPLLAEGTLEALDPWETPLDGFFARSHHNVMPASVSDSWTVTFNGLIAKPAEMTVRELKKHPSTSLHAVLECSGNGRGLFSPQVSGIQWQRGAVGNAEWTGARFDEVIKNLGVDKDAVYATFEGFDEPVMISDAKFVRSIPLKLLYENHAVLAWNMNRQPIPIIHGGPVRLVIPNIYGQNWVKWVNKITFSKDPDHRLYAKKAYRMPDQPVKPGDAWDPVKQGKPIECILVQSIVTYPRPNDAVTPGPVKIRGKAFSGTGPIQKVEISFDWGSTWQTAKLTPPIELAWQEFEFDFTTADGTTYDLWTRATDVQGHVQPISQQWNPKGYLYNAVDRVRFSARALETPLAEGKALSSTHCETCHSIGMAEGQRLSKSDWLKTIKKMSDYGLALQDSEAEKIAAYFSARFPIGTPPADARPVELSTNTANLVPPQFGSNSAGRPASGKTLFAKYCQGCHGVNGEGQVAPNLKGRSVTDATYYFSVINGKRNMPSFKKILSNTDLSDIRSWLLQPRIARK